MAFSWTDLLEPAAQLGGAIVGNKLNPSPERMGAEERKREFDVTTQRADQARNMLAPTLQRQLGTPYAAGSSLGGSYGAYGGYGAPQSGGGGGTLKTVAGIGMTAAPMIAKMIGGGGASSLPAALGGAAVKGAGGAAAAGGGAGFMGTLGALATNPITWAVGGGLIGAKLLRKIGQGRRTADKLTGEGDIQSNLQKAIFEISRRKEAGLITPEQHDMLLERVFRDSAQKGLQFAGNGDQNKRKTVQQMLSSYNWNPVMARIAPEYLAQLG